MDTKQPMITIYDDDSTTLDEKIAAWQAGADYVLRELAGLKALREKFPDATFRSKYSEPRWWSAAAHEVATNIDPTMLSGDPRAQRGCLYVTTTMDGVEARVYSSRPVDLVAGFAAFEVSKGALSLIDALKATTRDAEAYQARKDRERDEQEKRHAEDARAAEARKMGRNTVVINGPVDAEGVAKALGAMIERATGEA